MATPSRMTVQEFIEELKKAFGLIDIPHSGIFVFDPHYFIVVNGNATKH